MVFDFSQSYEAVSREAPHPHVKHWNPINFVRWLLPPLPTVELVFNLPTFLAPVDVSTKVSPNSLFWRRYCLFYINEQAENLSNDGVITLFADVSILTNTCKK